MTGTYRKIGTWFSCSSFPRKRESSDFDFPELEVTGFPLSRGRRSKAEWLFDSEIGSRQLRSLLVLGCLLLTACAGNAPRQHADALFTLDLQLSPASLGHELALQQQLNFQFGKQQRTLDALLEVDSNEVRLEVQSMGQSALRLRWDGKHLEQHRAAWLPPALRGEQVLSDLQLAQWPVSAIRAGLPSGWSLLEDSSSRVLRHGEAAVTTVRYPAPDRIEIEHARFSLSIVSVPAQAATP